MAVTLRSFGSTVSNLASAAQGACQTLINLSVGSVLSAVLEASAGLSLWLQQTAIAIAARTRLASSVGPDVDSFVNDFGMTRLGATFATSSVQMSSLNPVGQAATIFPGATVRTSNASATYVVTQDTTNPAWSVSAGGYVRQQGTTSVVVPIQATVAGSVGNVPAGAINVLGSAISGIDTVTNLLAVTDGQDVETDAAVQARFPVYINTRSQGTLLAIEYAVSAVQTGIIYQVVANDDAAGNPLPGNIVVYVDDGSGSPPQTLLSAVYAAVDTVRPFGTSLSVVHPVVTGAVVNMTVTVAAGFTPSAVQASVSAALTAYINSVGIGGTLSYSRLIAIAYGVSGVSNVIGTTLNGSNSDLSVNAGQVVRASSVTVATN
ncbi:baseplate J/gp47 family protein [Acetobacteraceae bacterium KSS8]|uniref:Baseplate J/gp47 family protein n=1 Tax=Endosaccharibacter trunci TaxID=2812733 RepID=A0ABT1WAE1_9PROT|nr:baseplate J/gp47 family protein [Acetobacteraceae bacterium KSS8]